MFICHVNKVMNSMTVMSHTVRHKNNTFIHYVVVAILTSVVGDFREKSYHVIRPMCPLCLIFIQTCVILCIIHTENNQVLGRLLVTFEHWLCSHLTVCRWELYMYQPLHTLCLEIYSKGQFSCEASFLNVFLPILGTV